MPLPSPPTPTFETTVPSTKKKVKYRPFLVREEKILLITMEGEPDVPTWTNNEEIDDQLLSKYEKEKEEWEDDVKKTVKDLLNSCILSRIKVDDLTNFDLEYLFLRIRAASSGEDIVMQVTCSDDNETKVNARINLMDVEVKFPEGHDNKIMLGEEMGMVMKYPGMNVFVDQTLLNKGVQKTEELFDLIADCVDQIFDGESVYDSADIKRSEIMAFIEKMTQQQFEKLQEFFKTMPVLSHTFSVVNPNTGVKSEYTMEGLSTFFG